MIKQLRTSFLLPAELSETASKYVAATADLSAADPFIARITGLLQTDIDNLNAAITAVRLNKLVDDVAAADALRDDLFIGFKDLVDAYKRRKNQALVDAYEQIWPIIYQAGTRLYTLGYAEQSGKLEALFTELDKPENQTALATMHADGIYADLKQAQADFVTIYNSRLDEDTKKNYPTLSEAKSKTVPHVNILLDAINILDETDPGTHGALIDKLNGITTSIMAVARARKSRGESGEELEAAE
ncbi:MAG: DUF6261 family protein [Ekhidna sp.]|uniref:DUF6261 family protein n=1 Tax=Ekhidna sp. TaxID=2608089 RepID=UPI0032EE9B9D